MQSCKSKCQSFSIEPAATLLMTSIIMCSLLVANLQIESTCLLFRNNTAAVCKEIVNANNSFADEEIEIQKIIADANTYKALVDNTLKLLFVLLIGHYGDKRGRRIPLLISTFGTILLSCTVLVISLFTHVLGPYAIVFIEVGVGSIFGKEVGFCLSAYSYMSDTSDESSRTLRTGILNTFYSSGVPLGYAIIGALMSAGAANYICAIVAISCSTASFLIVFFTVNKVPEKEAQHVVVFYNTLVSDDKQDVQKERCCGNRILHNSFLFFRNIIIGPFAKLQNTDRQALGLLFMLLICISAPQNGEFSLIYLFVRQRLQWNASEFGLFSIYNHFMSILGVVLSMGILVKWLNLGDPLVGFISGFSQLGGSLIYAFASNTTMMLLAPVMDMLNGTMIVVGKSMMSKIVRAENVGKLFSMLSILDILTPLVAIPVYNTIYRFTVDEVPGTFYLLSAAITLVPLMIYLWFILVNVQRQRKSVRKRDSCTNGDIIPSFSEHHETTLLLPKK